MPDIDIAIIGAGLAGLACARALTDAGAGVVVLEKSRGVGGRLATRRAEGGLQFDHGAQFVTSRQPGFASILHETGCAKRAAEWEDGSGAGHVVGVPGMNALAKHLASGLDIWTGVHARRVEPASVGWSIVTEMGEWRCNKLVLTAPAPQAMALLGEDHPLAEDLAAVRMAPCLALMAAFEPGAPRPFPARRDPQDALAWIARDGSKPGRGDAETWVAHASPEWSAEHLERSFEDIAARMLPMLCERIGADPGTAIHAVAHRWRYALVTTPLGRSFARDASATLYAGGDWCLGPRAEAAWESGTAIAEDILGAAALRTSAGGWSL
ncbi:NAD(P)/FAD-dependent oxidoreductase [Tropicimonas sediminicola]|uniref:Amine oxidase domain-containing protein n=1 Tax=Tropicimonas sediminicola TaxID=1031541 RepID=A0A239CAS4_9RHOB|nr:FAD-dependent oxidoreductase [Tropicimonas sediminicola]SNS17336.1 hypothetical protein SAMN05421757_101188 [Tropicimonas sediminicola]